MQLAPHFRHGLIAGIVSILACAPSMAAEEVPASGYLDATVEAQLSEVTLSSGMTVDRWISPQLTGDKYKGVMVDRVIFYPAPNPGPQISSATLEGIADYLTQALRTELGKDVNVVDKAGPGVLRMQPAITAVTVTTEGLSVKDVLPIHLLFTAAKTVAGKQAQNVVAAVEVRISDSVSGEPMAAAKRKIHGKPLKDEKSQLTLDDYKEALDQGAADGAAALVEALAP